MLENSVNSWDTKVFLAGFSLFSWFSEKPANGLLRKKKKLRRREMESNFMVLFLCLGNAREVLLSVREF